MTVTASSGKQLFNPTFAGFIFEYTSSSSASLYTTTVLQFTSSNCFAGAETIPLSGSVTGNTLVLNSFAIVGQAVQLSATGDSTGTQLQGTYTVQGGCGNGATGTFEGVKYTPLAGTYTGTFPAGATTSLILKQATLGNGDGRSVVSGAATFAGISCFSKATLDADQSTVLGSAVSLKLTATDGEAISLTGTSDPAGDTLNLTSATVSGGSCAGDLGAATLTNVGERANFASATEVRPSLRGG